jgi:hypothetical protein
LAEYSCKIKEFAKPPGSYAIDKIKKIYAQCPFGDLDSANIFVYK